jgi:hypothetical protein
VDGRSKRPYTICETERFARRREQQVLSIAYRSTKFSAHPTVSARKIAYDLWYGSGKGEAQ